MAGAAVVLTGAGSGIGRATAERLLARGHTVLGGAISEEEAATLSAELGSGFSPFVVDVRDGASVQAAAGRIEELLAGRPLRALGNIAGVITNGPLVDLEPEVFTNVLAVNLVGMHAMTRALMPLLRAGDAPRVVNMSSASGSRTLPFTGAYSASKFGVEALSSAMRMEFAPLGVRVVVVAPGLINTPMAGKIRHDLAEPPSLDVYREPLRRFLAGTEKSVANGVPLDRVVETITTAIEEPVPKPRYELHQSVLRDRVLLRVLPAGPREAIARRMLALGDGPPR